MSRPNDWVLWDTETTGIGRTAEIVQIGVLASDGSVLLDTLVRPLNRKRISADATAIHGITMKMLVDAPSYPELVPALIKLLKVSGLSHTMQSSKDDYKADCGAERRAGPGDVMELRHA